MAFEHRENSGTLFKNDYKKEDRHPDLKGQINVGGHLYDIAAWRKQTNSGDGFFSLSVSEPRQQPAQQQPAQQQQNWQQPQSGPPPLEAGDPGPQASDARDPFEL